MKKRTRITAVLMAAVLCLFFAIPAGAASSSSLASSVSGELPIVTYACPISGAARVYSYSDSSLSTRTTGYYIDTFTDQIVVTKISADGRAVYVTYPSSSTSSGYRSRWFAADDIFGVTAVVLSGYTAGGGCTTYRLSGVSSVVSYGSIDAGDYCMKLGTRSVGGAIYEPTAYPVASKTCNGVRNVRHKLALVRTGSSASPASSGDASRLLTVAKNELGYRGTKSNGTGSGDYTKYGVFTNTNGKAWCASFVAWAANKAGISTSVIPKTAACRYMAADSNSYVSWTSGSLRAIKPGDVVFFSSGSTGGTKRHVGIVSAVNGSKVSVIEGNTGTDTVKNNTYNVSTNGCINQVWSYSGVRYTMYFCGYIAV